MKNYNMTLKQTKTIEDQGEKKVDTLEALKLKPKETKPNEYSDYFLKGLAEIQESFEPVNFYDLTYNCKDSKILSVDSIKFKGPNNIFKNIHDGNIALEYVEKEQIKLKSNLGYIKQGNLKNKLPEQAKTINNIENL